MNRAIRFAAALLLSFAATAALTSIPASGQDTKGARVNKVGKIDPRHIVAIHYRQDGMTIDVLDPGTGNIVKNIATFPKDVGVDLGDPNALCIASGNHGAWLPDSSAVVIPGWFSSFGAEENIMLAPCLYAATPAGEASLAKVWKEAAGKGNVTCITPDSTGNVIYIVFSMTAEGGGKSNDVWAWNRETDETTQLTQTGNVMSIGGYGR